MPDNKDSKTPATPSTDATTAQAQTSAAVALQTASTAEIPMGSAGNTTVPAISATSNADAKQLATLAILKEDYDTKKGILKLYSTDPNVQQAFVDSSTLYSTAQNDSGDPEGAIRTQQETNALCQLPKSEDDASAATDTKHQNSNAENLPFLRQEFLRYCEKIKNCDDATYHEYKIIAIRYEIALMKAYDFTAVGALNEKMKRNLQYNPALKLKSRADQKQLEAKYNECKIGFKNFLADGVPASEISDSLVAAGQEYYDALVTNGDGKAAASIQTEIQKLTGNSIGAVKIPEATAAAETVTIHHRSNPAALLAAATQGEPVDLKQLHLDLNRALLLNYQGKLKEAKALLQKIFPIAKNCPEPLRKLLLAEIYFNIIRDRLNDNNFEPCSAIAILKKCKTHSAAYATNVDKLIAAIKIKFPASEAPLELKRTDGAPSAEDQKQSVVASINYDSVIQEELAKGNILLIQLCLTNLILLGKIDAAKNYFNQLLETPGFVNANPHIKADMFFNYARVLIELAPPNMNETLYFLATAAQLNPQLKTVIALLKATYPKLFPIANTQPLEPIEIDAKAAADAASRLPTLIVPDTAVQLAVIASGATCANANADISTLKSGYETALAVLPAIDDEESYNALLATIHAYADALGSGEEYNRIMAEIAQFKKPVVRMLENHSNSFFAHANVNVNVNAPALELTSGTGNDAPPPSPKTPGSGPG